MQAMQLGPYSIGQRLGRGGMGAVYEAVDSLGGETVAVKVLATHLADDAGLRRRFESEIETLKKLRHPGIVGLLAFGEQDGQPYFAMEIVRGQSIDKLLRDGRRFTWQETIAAALAVTRALKVAHDHGVIHRDLKPANLLLPEGAPTSDVKLADFGIAKLFGGVAHTALGNIVGTAEYMAPEQSAGKAIDARADLYALGLVMHAMLTGKPPFRASNVAEVMRMQQVMPPPRLAPVVADLPPAMDDLIQRLLAKNPADRPASALAVGRLLAGISVAATAPAPVASAATQVDGPVDEPPTHAARAQAATAAMPNAAARQPEGVDLFAPTRELTPQGGWGNATARVATDIASAATQADGESRTRHTTLAEVERAAAAAAAREARHQRRMTLLWAAAILFLLSAGTYVLLRPLTRDELLSRIQARLDAAADRQDALREIEPLIGQFLARHADSPKAQEMRGLKREIDIDRLRIRADRRETKGVAPGLRIERDYRRAMEQRTADPAGCLAALREILALPDPLAATPVTEAADTDELVRDVALWRELVARQIKSLTPLHDADLRLDRDDTSRNSP
jgi:hypothetical protein